MTDPVLDRLLDATARQHPEYRGGLANHLPMALHALAQLGADAPALAQFADMYVRRTGLQPLEQEVSALDDWHSAKGRIEAYGALRLTFARQIADRGVDATVRAALPELWKGVAAAAFHGPIRLAHALDAGHAGEVAAGLAYWAARWQPIEAPTRPRTLTMEDWLDCAARASAEWRSSARRIAGRMEEAASSTLFLRAASCLDVPSDAIARAAAWAAQVYAETGNFTVLHVVTGLRAVLVLSGWDVPPPSVWNAIFAAIQSSELAEREAPMGARCTWAELAAQARRSTDEHTIKLVHACRQFAAAGDGPIYLLAAARAVG